MVHAMVSDGRGGVMRIGPPQTKSDNDQVRWSVHVDADGLPDELWFSVTGLGGTGLSDRIDAAVIALLLPAMRAGFDIEADGLLTDVLADQLRRDYQPLVRLLMPFLSQVELRIRSVPPKIGVKAFSQVSPLESIPSPCSTITTLRLTSRPRCVSATSS